MCRSLWSFLQLSHPWAPKKTPSFIFQDVWRSRCFSFPPNSWIFSLQRFVPLISCLIISSWFQIPSQDPGKPAVCVSVDEPFGFGGAAVRVWGSRGENVSRKQPAWRSPLPPFLWFMPHFKACAEHLSLLQRGTRAEETELHAAFPSENAPVFFCLYLDLALEFLEIPFACNLCWLNCFLRYSLLWYTVWACRILLHVQYIWWDRLSKGVNGSRVREYLIIRAAVDSMICTNCLGL